MVNPTPRTIEELRAWYAAHDLPPEDVTRFFIGKNITEPKAFGIYRDGDCFIVYKNKADGSRAVRYQGPDEGCAVNELYMRLKEEIGHQKEGAAFGKGAHKANDRKSKIISAVIAVVIIAAIGCYVIAGAMNTPSTGYYRYNDDWYYYFDGWYAYGDDGWYPAEYTDELNDHYNDYYTGYIQNDSNGITDFEQTEYYSHTDSDSSWDSNDTWDSGSTNWNSDW